MIPKHLSLKLVSNITITIVVALIVMTLTAVYLYPENLNNYSNPSLIWTISLLLIYLVFCIRIPAIGSGINFHMAIIDGTRIGLITGAIWVIHITIEYFVSISRGLNGIITLFFMGILFISFGISAYTTMKKTGKMMSALLSGLWCAMLSILMLFAYGLPVNFIFMPHLMTILQYDEEFKMSRMSIASYTIHNTLESAGTHLLIAPVVAIIFSLLAVVFLKMQRVILKK